MKKNFILTIFVLALFALIACTKTPVENLAGAGVIETDAQNSVNEGYVAHVTDGDTFQINSSGTIMKIQLIGINAPNIAYKSTQGQCYSEEAKNKAKEMLLGKQVVLLADKGQQNKDKYERYLRYLELNGEDIAEVLLSGGYVKVYNWTTFDRMEKYKTLEATARAEKKGLWGECSN